PQNPKTPCIKFNNFQFNKMVDLDVVKMLESMQMIHSKLLLIVTELYRRDMINDDQKLALKFGILNDDLRLMDFYNTRMEALNVSKNK
ncbi:MAG: hypothetical protein ACKO96_14775, partial [Flammeovirgaceae bacterium]